MRYLTGFLVLGALLAGCGKYNRSLAKMEHVGGQRLCS
jgi:hypothetical protein